jgi:hypothetical protein
MAKKGFLMLVLAALVAGGIFAQDDTTEGGGGGAKNFVSGDVGLLMFGVRYERLLSPKLSVGADFYWANSFFYFTELDVGVFARYYLFKGLFGELGLGYHRHTGIGDVDFGGASYNGLITTSGFGISPGVGWKFDVGSEGGFFIEPGLSIPITIGKKSVAAWSVYKSDDIGVGVGFVIYCGLGWAF